MLRILIKVSVLIALGYIAPGYADDSLLQEIAKREKVSVDAVKKSIKEGCDSGITPLMNECAQYLYIGSDIQLNHAYQALVKKFNASDSKILLVDMQKAWIALRDATCSYESASWDGGTGYNAVYTMCLKKETDERTKILNRYIRCESGCPWDQ